MTARVTLDLPAALPAALVVGGRPARPGEPVAVDPGPTVVSVRVAFGMAGWEVEGVVTVAVDVPPGAAVRLSPPRLAPG